MPWRRLVTAPLFLPRDRQTGRKRTRLQRRQRTCRTPAAGVAGDRSGSELLRGARAVTSRKSLQQQQQRLGMLAVLCDARCRTDVRARGRAHSSPFSSCRRIARVALTSGRSEEQMVAYIRVSLSSVCVFWLFFLNLGWPRVSTREVLGIEDWLYCKDKHAVPEKTAV